MAAGLNSILGLGEEQESQANKRWVPAMEKVNTRIPKLGFGFRKSAKTNGTVSEGNSPRGGIDDPPRAITPTRAMTPTGRHSAPGSNNTSPNLSRSKSLRVPRSRYQGLKSQSSTTLAEETCEHDYNLTSHSSSSLLERNEDTEHVVMRGSGLVRPRSKTIGSSSRRLLAHRNSRSMSPLDSMQGSNESNVDKDTHEESHFQRRTKSFSAKKYGLMNGTTSPTPDSISRASSVRRSKTPTSLMTSVRSKDSSNGGGKGLSGQGLVRTGSGGRGIRYSTQLQDGQGVVRRQSGGRRDASGLKLKRPSSVHVSEDAGIFINVDDSSHNEQADGRMGSSLAPSGVSKRSRSSMGYSSNPPRSPSPPPTGLSSNSATLLSSQSSTGSASSGTASKSSKFLSAKTRSSSIENPSRPNSATSCYQVRRTSVTKDSRSHTPSSSGRSTPVQRLTLGIKEGTDGGVASRTNSSLPPRTPYRVARTKAVPSSEVSGMNELEGSVLLEADDYRRLLNEVKALKTALLRLKREIQEDTGGTPAQSSRVGRSRTSPSAGQVSSTEFNKKLKAAEQEKEVMTDEITRLKKENKMKSSRLESLIKELCKEKERHLSAVEELQQVTGQRDRLLDKVERLHADKHTLEARLNTLERASIYEQTWSESWLDELDGGEESFGESLETDPSSSGKGREKRGTESDVTDSLQSDGGEGESSEPESSAVCSAPII